MSQTSHEDPTIINRIVRVSDPLLDGWKLCYGPNNPRLNALKDQLLVHTPNLDKRLNDSSISTIAGGESSNNETLQEEAVLAPPNKRQRSASFLSIDDIPEETIEETHIEALISSNDIPITQPQITSRTPSANAQSNTPRRRLPNMLPEGNNKRISTAPFASSSRPGSTTTKSASQRRVLPNMNTSSTSSKSPVNIPNLQKKSQELYDKLSAEQREVFDYIFSNIDENVFFSGSAGTGKTVLLRAIISKLQYQHMPWNLAITAPTGVAAVNIQGVTIHSFARVNLGDKSIQNYVDQYNRNPSHITSLNKIRVLIVDEISMLDGELLDKIETICRKVRKNESKPFGGIRVIFCGDFFQLPPVSRDGPCRMAFEANCWKRVIRKVFILKTPFRQKDPQFIQILNEIRHGCLSVESEDTLKKLSRTPNLGAGIVPTELYSLKHQVTSSNNSKLRQLPGESYTYVAVDQIVSSYYANELENHKTSKELVLKENAQVMLIKNLTQTLVNGSIGKVIGFEKIDNVAYPIVHFSNGERKVMKREEFTIEKQGKIVASRRQVPLILAYAISIHKSQGQTIEFAKVNLDNSFEQGQVYVALSRATEMRTLQVLNFKKNAIRVNPRVVKFYKEYEK